MQNLKHVGRVKSTQKKVLVAYRTIPGDAYHCLIIPTEQLDDSRHNAIISLVESNAGQEAYEFAQALDRTQFPDGARMLPWLHVNGKLIKAPTDQIEMLPRPGNSILLSELNQIIAEQQGLAVDDLAIKPSTHDKVEIKEIATVTEIPTPKSEEPVVDFFEKVQQEVSSMEVNDQAKRFRSEADRLSKEAAKFRRLAEDIAPTRKK